MMVKYPQEREANLAKISKVKVIYNPHAGKKRKLLPNPLNPSLDDLKLLFEQYQIPADFFPTKRPGHATILAGEAVRQRYKMVVAAGGDGTVGETASGLVGKNIPLAILPLGSFMNIARMLSIPLDPEKAVTLIKIGRLRTIDAGLITGIKRRHNQNSYFFESCGIGLEAKLNMQFLDIEHGRVSRLIDMFKTFAGNEKNEITITMDGKKLNLRKASWINISNSPYSGLGVASAPKAKLNDHRLTVSVFRMSSLELLKHFFSVLIYGNNYSPKVEIHKSIKNVVVEAKSPVAVHADARLYGETPIKVRILPNALTVITGFPKPDSPFQPLNKRVELDPF